MVHIQPCGQITEIFVIVITLVLVMVIKISLLCSAAGFSVVLIQLLFVTNLDD